MKAGKGCQTHNIIILDSIGLAPRIHDPRIVKSNHSDDIYAFRLNSLEVVNVAGEVAGGAAGSEGAYGRGGASACIHV